MKALGDTLIALAVQFTILSLLAFGGVNAVIPEMHRQAVEAHHWMSDADFSALFAISQAAPGPNFMIATLVGWKTAGLAGAAVASLALCLPSCLLTYWAAKAWDRYRNTRLRRAIAAGLAPLTAGLVGSTALIMIRTGDRSVGLAATTLAVAALAYFTRLNPLWALAGAAALGLLGLL